MLNRITILGSSDDGRALFAKSHLSDEASVRIADVYTSQGEMPSEFASAVCNPITQEVMQEPPEFTWAIEIGFLPGVTDNVGNSASEMIGLICENGNRVYSSRIYFLNGVCENEAKTLSAVLANPLINSIKITSNYNDLSPVLPVVEIHKRSIAADEVNLNVSDEELRLISSKGIKNRGPLGLSLQYMHAIAEHFKTLGRNPRDIELEMIAQSWSEHCKHTIFASPIDEISDGLYKHYIKRATKEIRKNKGDDDFCVSVFSDNAGAIVFDENWLICDKVETHNSPSALDPFGGAITGIVGVNRDCLGFGMGARPIVNRYGFCFAPPNACNDYYRDKSCETKILPQETIIEGVVSGVEHGGNCSGIPTPQGFVYFDDRFIGKPLVFVGTIGLIPREVAGKPSHDKCARAGDCIVVAGGSVGADGIHGATFSSVALDEGAPATAVQIGDPITQKKMSDALIEIRDKGWYSAVTDNGAGGLSSSVGEMAEGSGGFHAELDKVPLKYNGLSPWQIWISESQERMTFSASRDNAKKIIEHFAKRGVDAHVIGEFTDTGKAVASWHGEVILDLSMDFVHDGVPVTPLKTTFTTGGDDTEPELNEKDLGEALLELLARPNISSNEEIATRFDHGVQGGVVLNSIQGKGRVYADTSIVRPLFDSKKGVVLSQSTFPRYSDIDTGAMAAAGLDMSVRNAVAAGADFNRLALLDNFCWCSSDEPSRLGQLKKAAQEICNLAIEYGTPFISGKDSMFNDFKGYDAKGEEVKISAPPTLLISSIGIIDDVANSIDIAPKAAGDMLYLLGDTKDECGAGEYYAMRGVLGKNVPQTNSSARLYKQYSRSSKKGLFASAISLGLGGLGAGLAKSAIAGNCGLEIDLSSIDLPPQKALFSESTGRILVSVAPKNVEKFEKTFKDAKSIGHVSFGCDLNIRDLFCVPVTKLSKAYKSLPL